MNKQSVIDGLSKISAVMTENKEYLIKLDQQNGDGDLGVSMSEGFAAAAAFAAEAEETDLGKLMMQTGKGITEIRLCWLRVWKKTTRKYSLILGRSEKKFFRNGFGVQKKS